MFHGQYTEEMDMKLNRIESMYMSQQRVRGGSMHAIRNILKSEEESLLVNALYEAEKTDETPVGPLQNSLHVYIIIFSLQQWIYWWVCFS